MVEDPFDPLEWGIEARTAADIWRFDGPGRLQASHGRITDPWPARAISDRVPKIERIARGLDHGRWFWHTRPPHPSLRHTEPPSSPRLNAWTPDDDAALTDRWTVELDHVVDGYISHYRSAWHDVLATARPESNAISLFIHDSIRSGGLRPPKRRGYPTEVLLDYKLANATINFPFNVTCARRQWEFPTERICACCGAAHYYDVADPELIRRYGEPGICAPCMDGALRGQPHFRVVTRTEILASVRELAELTKLVPGKSFREAVYTAGMSASDRAIVVALLLSIPSPSALMGATSSSSWLQLLKAAGVEAPEGWQPADGAICLANDGHRCRSLAEKAVCDWLHSRHVNHSVNPPWPRHPELNPSGELHADWSVGDVYIEFTGHLGRIQYQEMVARKARLAAETGIDLMLVAPEDLLWLDSALSRFLDRGQSDSTARKSRTTVADTTRSEISMGTANGADQPDSDSPVQYSVELHNSNESTSSDDFTSVVEHPAGMQSTEGHPHPLLPRLVVAAAETADGAGNFDVGILSADGSVLHAGRLNQFDVDHRIDIILDLDDPALGAFEVRVAIRPRPPHQEEPEAEHTDNFGYSDYR